MNGEFLENQIIKYIPEHFIDQLVKRYPQLTLWRGKYFILPQGFNKNTASVDELQKAKNALFVIRNNVWTEIHHDERKTKDSNDTTLAKADKANRDIVLYELVHDKNGEVIYHNNGFPLYRKIPLMNLECKISHYSNISEIFKRTKYKSRIGKTLNKKESNIYILKKYFDWCLKQKDIIEKYPEFKEPEYEKDLLLSFFTTLTQSDNSYAILSFDDKQNQKSEGYDLTWNWGYISKDKAKKQSMLCPEINVEYLKRFIQDNDINKMPKEVREILNKLVSKKTITKQDREYFVFGSDQKFRSLNIIKKEDIKIFAKVSQNGFTYEDPILFEDIFKNKNKYTNFSMEDIVNNYLQHKNKTQKMYEERVNKIEKEKEETDCFKRILNKQKTGWEVLNEINKINKK